MQAKDEARYRVLATVIGKEGGEIESNAQLPVTKASQIKFSRLKLDNLRALDG